MRAWIRHLDDDHDIHYHGISGTDLDALQTYCRERGEVERSGGDMKYAGSFSGAVIMAWCNARGISWDQFHRDQGIQAKFLNDPDNSELRIWKGRV